LDRLISVKFFYSEKYELDLPKGHRFPAQKYALLKDALIKEGILIKHNLVQAPKASDDQLLLAHSDAYIRSINDGTIEPRAMRRIGLPWTPQTPLRAKTTVGGALCAARTALSHGISGMLAGGTHHAHFDFGAGYCVFNDFAVVARVLLHESAASSVAIVDLDVHQGDGNAAILGGDDRVFILSVHGEKNFPFRKFPSTLDVPLSDGTEDEPYLLALENALDQVWDFQPDLILYQAGVDPLVTDKLGRMALTFEGLTSRDKMVLRGAKVRNIPVSMAIGGGYADPIEDSVTAYVNTYRVAKKLWNF